MQRFHVLCGGLLLLLVVVFLSWRWVYATWQIQLARQSLLDSDAETGLSILAPIERLQPNRAELLYLLARAHRRSGDLKKASAYLEKAASNGWPAEEINQQRYLAVLQSGQFDQVEPYFKRLLQEGVSDELAAEYYEAQARALLHAYRFQEAMVCLNYWIDWRPQALRPRLWRAEIWERILYYSEAITEYSRILELAPQHAEARRRLGRNLFEANKPDLALDAFNRCLELDPQDPEARIGIARCHQRQGNLAEAERQLRAILKSELTSEQKATAVTELATIVLEQKQSGEAIKLLTEASDQVRTNPVAQYVLSRAYTQAGDRERAAAHAAESKRIYAQYARLAEITKLLLTQPVNADLRYEAGRILMEQGLLREGAAWMTTALRDNPGHREAQQALARYGAQIGSLQRGNQQPSVPPADPSLEQAMAALNSKDVSQIRQQWQALDAPSSSPALRHLLQGAIHLLEGDPTASLRELELANSDPVKAVRLRARIFAGQAMSQLGRQKEAESQWLRAVTEDPDSGEAHRWLAMMYYELGAMDDAQRHALRVGALSPQDPRPYRLLGLMRKDSEHYEDAIQYYQEALRRNPQPPSLHEIRMELAECQIKLGQHAAALVSLHDCPRTVSRLVLEAECHFSTNRREQAELLLQEALRQSPDDFSARMLQGAIASERGDLPAAIDALASAAAVRPRDYQANLQLMQAYRRGGNQEEADKISKLVEELRALRLEFSELHERATAQPSDVAIRFRLGQVAQQLGQPELAQLWFRAVLAMDPQHEAARRELARIAEKPLPAGPRKAAD